jgi:hypothetical protein
MLTLSMIIGKVYNLYQMLNFSMLTQFHTMQHAHSNRFKFLIRYTRLPPPP